MNLEEAIKVLKDISRACLNHILNENISETSRKLYEDDIEAIDKVVRVVKIKDEYLKLLNDILIDYDGWHTAESLKELIDETRDYIHKALKNDDKSAIYSAGNGKSSNILGEVVE